MLACMLERRRSRSKEKEKKSIPIYDKIWIVEHRTNTKHYKFWDKNSSGSGTTENVQLQQSEMKRRENELEMPLIAATCMSWHNLDDECIIACKPFLMNGKEWMKNLLNWGDLSAAGGASVLVMAYCCCCHFYLFFICNVYLV